MDKLINTVFNESYCIKLVLSSQQGRRSFLAEDLNTGDSVVIKLLLFAPDFTWENLKLFEREAEVLKNLDHPTIPKYLDYFDVETEFGKGFALVQTYIKANSLQYWVDLGRTFSEEKVKIIAVKLLNILNYLHQRQPPVIHRDIKPSNILLGDRTGNSPGEVYLIDFGSVQTQLHGGTRTIVGTYGYMPPEQFGGESLPCSDLYSLGATLIYLATGRHPSELPHEEGRFEFEDKVNLKAYLIHWLKSLTHPSLKFRLQSVNDALIALESKYVPPSSPNKLTKFISTKIKLTKTNNTLQIVFPPKGWNGGLIVWGLITLCFGSPFILGSIILFFFILSAIGSWENFISCSIFFIITSVISYIFLSPFIRNLLLQKKCLINHDQIILRHTILGFDLPAFVNIPRQVLTKIEVSSNSNYIAFGQTPIWSRQAKKITLNNQYPLNFEEINWLANELESWLNLPVEGKTRHLQKNGKKLC